MTFNKSVSVLIPDECENSLGYYVARCLKAADKMFKVKMFTSSNLLSDDKSWLIFYQNSKYIDELFFSKNKVGSIKYLKEFIQILKDDNINFVMPASEIAFKFVSKFRSELEMFCNIIMLPSVLSLDTAFNKLNLSIFLDKHNISTPKTILARNLRQIEQLNFPLLLKPVNGSGGKNIQKIEKLEEIYSLNINNKGNNVSEETYIIQEYIDGHDIDCNVLCNQGKILVYSVQQPLGIEQEFTPKVDKLKFTHDSSVVELVQRTMSQLEWNGIAHLDLRYCSKSGQLYLIEINPRFWQSLMGSLAVGINFPYLLYLLSNNIDFEQADYQEKYYAKFSRFIKDSFNGSVNYNLGDTNLKYILTDLNAGFQFSLHRIIKSIKSN